jgi:hypothetical protein
MDITLDNLQHKGAMTKPPKTFVEYKPRAQLLMLMILNSKNFGVINIAKWVS